MFHTWIGVDFDGTLVKWGTGHNTNVMAIGEPIPRMVARVKAWLADGKDVRILTARVGPATDEECMVYGFTNAEHFAMGQRMLIEPWCEEHLGQKLIITATKDFHMVELWDDRAVQLVPNSGLSITEALRS